jgi:poly(A) polymerase
MQPLDVALALLDQLVRNEQAVADQGTNSTAQAYVAGLRRLAALLPADDAAAEQVASRLRLSKRQRGHLRLLAVHRADGGVPIRQLAYRIGMDAARDAALLRGDRAGALADAQALHGWSVPDMPLKGGDIVARGLAKGPQVAELLKAVEAQWLAEDFPDQARVMALLDQKAVEQKAGAQKAGAQKALDQT